MEKLFPSRVLGLDLGIASCGYALVDLTENSIVCCGVRTFDGAENPKDGSSLALPRRIKRSMRRLVRRKAKRMAALRKLLANHQLIPNAEPVDALPGADPYELRAEGLRRVLTDPELAKVLLHIAKRRGFRSSKREVASSGDDKEQGRLLEGVNSFEAEREKNKLPTAGAYLATLPKKRNDRGSYSRTLTQAALQNEASLLLRRQRELGNSSASLALETEYVRIAFYRRPLKSFEHLVGRCELEPAERRAAKATYSAQLFSVLQTLCNLRIQHAAGRPSTLTEEQFHALLELAHNKQAVKYSTVRKALCINPAYTFSGLWYSRADNDRDPEDQILLEMKAYHSVRKLISKADREFWKENARNNELLDAIGTALTLHKDEEQVVTELRALGLEERIVQALVPLSFAGHTKHSLTALRKLISHMRPGCTYYDALAAAYRNSDGPIATPKGRRLPPFGDITNPVVRRALAQARKVTNAVFARYGVPDAVNIEFARDLSRSFKERREVDARQKQLAKYKRDVASHFQETFGHPPRPQELFRFRLWKEQNGRCPYSGTAISPNEVVDETATQVDHVVPYSRCFDDSMVNKVLVRTRNNQEKGERIPAEYLAVGSSEWTRFEAEVANYPVEKRRRLLRREFSAEDEREWKERHLNDTRYIAREFAKHLTAHIDLGDEGRRHVFARKGAMTSKMRYLWGFGDKDREKDDRHHALDAIIIACTTEKMVFELENYFRCGAFTTNTFMRSEKFQAPWENFRRDALVAVANATYSCAPRRSVSGPLHEDTIRSLRHLPEGPIIVERVPVEKLTVQMLDSLFQKERNRKLYAVLRERLTRFTSNPQKAFAEPLYMPTNDPRKRGPQIKAVTIISREQSGVVVRGEGKLRKGIASNGELKRLDIFIKEGKFYPVPVYTYHFARGILPNRSVVANRPESQWLELDTTFAFLFCLYPNDCVRIEKRNGEVMEGLYTGFNRNTCSLSIKPYFAKDAVGSIGIRTLRRFEKYYVGVLGDLHAVKKERRHVVASSGRGQPRPAEQQKSPARNFAERGELLAST